MARSSKERNKEEARQRADAILKTPAAHYCCGPGHKAQLRDEIATHLLLAYNQGREGFLLAAPFDDPMAVSKKSIDALHDRIAFLKAENQTAFDRGHDVGHHSLKNCIDTQHIVIAQQYTKITELESETADRDLRISQLEAENDRLREDRPDRYQDGHDAAWYRGQAYLWHRLFPHADAPAFDLEPTQAAEDANIRRAQEYLRGRDVDATAAIMEENRDLRNNRRLLHHEGWHEGHASGWYAGQLHLLHQLFPQIAGDFTPMESQAGTDANAKRVLRMIAGLKDDEFQRGVEEGMETGRVEARAAWVTERKSLQRRLDNQRDVIKGHFPLIDRLRSERDEAIERARRAIGSQIKTYDSGYNKGHVEGTEAGGRDGYNKGHAIGLADGMKIGRAKGQPDSLRAFDRGYACGAADGKKTGRPEGQSDAFKQGYNAGFDRGYRRGYSDRNRGYPGATLP